MLNSERAAESSEGDVLLLPIAAVAFWTLAYQLVLVLRWPAKTITWCFLAIALAGFLALGRLWKKTSEVPGKGYRFHPSQILLVGLGLAYSATALFVRRPNQDDVVYVHRALTQLLALNQPITLHQTSVDMDAAAFSPVHLATSYEMLMAFLGHYLGVDPLYFYQVIGHAFAAFSVPFVFYWCARIFGLNRWAAAIGSLLGIAFLLLADESSLGALLGAGFSLVAGQSLASINTAGMLGFATVSGYMWQGKPIVLYLIPAAIGCSWLAFFALELFEQKGRDGLREQVRRGFCLAIPVVYPIAILLLLALNIIPKPIDTRMYGPSYMPWGEALNYVIGRPAEYVRDVMLMIVVPLLIVKGRSGLFLFFYLCAVWLLCLNPLLAPWWMRNILAYCYFRLVYLLQLPLLCTLLAAAGSRLAQPGSLLKDRLATALVLLAVIVSFVFSYRGLSIMPRDAKLGIGWKSPREYQLLPANTDFARVAARYIAHAKLLAPDWTASCELPLLFPEMKVVAPRLVSHYFANAGNPEEGVLRRQAQAFVEEDRSANPKRLQSLETKFRQVIETGRANAVAVPESESQRVLATLKSINPGWHRVLEGGGLVLMLPSDADQRLE